MRVLLTTHQFFPRHFAGTEVAARDTGLELLERGHEVHVLTVDPAPGHSGPEVGCVDYDHRGLRVHALRIPDRLPARRGGADPVRLEYADDAVAAHVGEWARRLAPDVVHMFHLARLSGATLDALRELGVPLVFTATDFWSVCVRSILMRTDGELCGGPDRISSNCLECRGAEKWFGIEPPTRRNRRRALYRRLARDAAAGTGSDPVRAETVRAVLGRGAYLRERLERVDAILAPTSLMREMLVRNGLPADLIRVHPYSIDVSRFDAVRRTRRRGERGLRFAYVGTLRRPKGVHVLIEAFRRLRDRDATLEVIGDVDSEPDYFRELYELAAGDDRIRFAGGIPNEQIPARLERIDVQVVPSIWYENAPLTIYSAQAAGIPVVASDLGGMSEVVAHEQNGLLFHSGDVDDLAGNLQRLAREPGLVEHLSVNAQVPMTAVEGVNRLLALYEEIRAAAPPAPERARSHGVDVPPRHRRPAPAPSRPAAAALSSPPGSGEGAGPADGHGAAPPGTSHAPQRGRRARPARRGRRRAAAGRRKRREAPLAFFLVGRAKSGTTWLMRTLDAHPEITCRGEGRFFGCDYVLGGPETATIPARPLAGALAADESLRSWLERSVWARDRDPNRQLTDLTRLAIDYFFAEAAREAGTPIIGDKTPFLSRDLVREIAQVHPTAKVMHIIRDGRDVAISAKHHVWNRSTERGGIHELDDADREVRDAYRSDPARFGADGRSIFAGDWLAGTASEWAQMVRRARSDGRELLGERYLEVRYEEMLADPFGSAERALGFLEADTAAGTVSTCVEQASFERATGGRNRGDEKPTEFLRNGLAGQWREAFTAGDREIFKREAGDLLIELGYEEDTSW
jgi:glycosyltransferase involved in cell wall biosynthesis